MKRRKQKEESRLQEVLVFYDVETCWDRNNDMFAVTYSCAYIAFLTMETQITPENLQQHIDETKMTLGPDACSEMLRDLAIRYPKE